MHPSEVTGILLVGGKSRRMGRDKALLELGGEPLFLRPFRMLAALCGRVLVVGDADGRYARFGVESIADRYPGSALGGLCGGIAAASTETVLVSPCDLPFPNARIASFLLSQSPPYDAVIPRSRSGLEPLFGVYRKSLLPEMLRQLEGGNPRVLDLFQGWKVRIVEAEEMLPLDPEERAFINLNTPEEAARIPALLAGM